MNDTNRHGYSRARQNDGRRPRSGAWFLLQLTAVMISAAGAMAIVRAASPSALDDPLMAFMLFLLIPASLAFPAALVHPGAGLGVSCVHPFFWGLLMLNGNGSLLIWLFPSLAIILIVLTGIRTGRSDSLRPIALLASMFLILCTYAWPMPGNPANGTKFLLIGIDGGTWKRIDPLVANGKMPNTARLIENGNRAVLRSVHPMISPQIWSTIATGFLASDHGVRDFGARQSDFHKGRIWDELKAEGRSIGLCEWLFTWPPIEGLGEHDFIIPSVFASDDRTYPASYQFFWNLAANQHPTRKGTMTNAECALDAIRYGTRLSTLRKACEFMLRRVTGTRSDLDEIWRSRRIFAAMQADISAELLRRRRPEFAAIYFSQVDVVSHFYWRFIEPEYFPDVPDDELARYRDAIDRIYIEIDYSIGKIRRASDRDADIIIVSDHGFQALKKRYGNEYCRIRTEGLLQMLGLSESVLGTNVNDWVYLRPTSISFSEQESVLSRLGESLGSIHLKVDTAPLFMIERDELVIHLKLSPRTILPPESVVIIEETAYPLEDILVCKKKARISGTHHPDGIWLFGGPSSRNASGSDTLGVLDVTPTIAAILGLPRDPDWPGRSALADTCADGMESGRFPLPRAESVKTTVIDESLKEKMRAIGYLE